MSTSPSLPPPAAAVVVVVGGGGWRRGGEGCWRLLELAVVAAAAMARQRVTEAALARRCRLCLCPLPFRLRRHICRLSSPFLP
jgi:hypothetical protein